MADPAGLYRMRPGLFAKARKSLHCRPMRPTVLLSLFLLACACGRPEAKPGIDRVEIRSNTLYFEVNRSGSGQYRRGEPPQKTASTFKVTPEQFSAIRDRVEPYRRAAEPTEPASRRFLNSVCPKTVPPVADAGMISIRWVGAGLDTIYIADFGCDHKRNAHRNARLRALLAGLPVDRKP